MSPNLRLSAYYLNTRRLASATQQDIPIAAQHSIINNSDARVIGMRMAELIADTLLRDAVIPNLTREQLIAESEHQSIVGALWGVFTFKGIPAAYRAERDGKKVTAASFSGSIPLGTDTFEVRGEMKNAHLVSDTATTILSGKCRKLVAGQFEFSGTQVLVHPWIIGDMIQDMSGLPIPWSNTVRVFPQQIDCFAGMANERRTTAAEISALKEVPEEVVKHAFAEIVGEPFVPKDWGGEKSDLSTSRLSVGGLPTSAAFIFKGPSVPGPMHLSKMGKNGDQLVRAFDEPVELVVVQHCNQITNPVVRVAEALASNLGRPRRYCIIDGADTVAILKSHGKFPR